MLWSETVKTAIFSQRLFTDQRSTVSQNDFVLRSKSLLFPIPLISHPQKWGRKLPRQKKDNKRKVRVPSVRLTLGSIRYGWYTYFWVIITFTKTVFAEARYPQTLWQIFLRRCWPCWCIQGYSGFHSALGRNRSSFGTGCSKRYHLLMSRLFWTIVPIFLCTIVQLFLSDILDNAVAVL